MRLSADGVGDGLGPWLAGIAGRLKKRRRDEQDEAFFSGRVTCVIRKRPTQVAFEQPAITEV